MLWDLTLPPGSGPCTCRTPRHHSMQCEESACHWTSRWHMGYRGPEWAKSSYRPVSYQERCVPGLAFIQYRIGRWAVTNLDHQRLGWERSRLLIRKGRGGRAGRRGPIKRYILFTCLCGIDIWVRCSCECLGAGGGGWKREQFVTITLARRTTMPRSLYLQSSNSKAFFRSTSIESHTFGTTTPPTDLRRDPQPGRRPRDG